MDGLTYHAVASWWWPYLFILLAGWLPTDIWRYLGVVSAGRLNEHSPWVALVRAIATALVAAVVARLVLFPSGSLELVPLPIRIGATAVGFLAYLAAGRRVLVGILAAEAVLLGLPLLLDLL